MKILSTVFRKPTGEHPIIVRGNKPLVYKEQYTSNFFPMSDITEYIKLGYDEEKLNQIYFYRWWAHVVSKSNLWKEFYNCDELQYIELQKSKYI